MSFGCDRARTRTGTRCTIFVKLPVAFSGGSTLKVAPVAGATLSTRPCKVRFDASSVDVDAVARAHPLQLVFLEVRVDPEA